MEQLLVTFSLRFKYDRGTSAASYALRNIAVGYLYGCLPLSWTRLITSRRNNIFFFTLKEVCAFKLPFYLRAGYYPIQCSKFLYPIPILQVILRQSDKAEYQDSGDEKILKLLFNYFESEEEGVSNVETKRLGKIALIEPEKLVTALKVSD